MLTVFKANERPEIPVLAKSANMPFKKGSTSMGQKTQKKTGVNTAALDGTVLSSVANNTKLRSQSTLKN